MDPETMLLAGGKCLITREGHTRILCGRLLPWPRPSLTRGAWGLSPRLALSVPMSCTMLCLSIAPRVKSIRSIQIESDHSQAAAAATTLPGAVRMMVPSWWQRRSLPCPENDGTVPCVTVLRRRASSAWTVTAAEADARPGVARCARQHAEPGLGAAGDNTSRAVQAAVQ